MAMTLARAVDPAPIVLVADDHAGSRNVLGDVFSHSGFKVMFASSGEEVIAATQQLNPEIVILELALSDGSGLDVVRTLRRLQCGARCIIVTAVGSPRLAVESMWAGAVNFLEKPLSRTALLQALAEAMSIGGHLEFPPLAVSVPHAISRWANLVTQVIASPHDLPTLQAWGRHVAASPGTTRNWCYTAGFPAKRSLSFARVLRAVVRQDRDRLSSDNLLDVVDQRTLRKLLSLGAETNHRSVGLPPDVETFLRLQRWIADDAALRVVRTAALRLSAARHTTVCAPEISSEHPLRRDDES